MVYLLIQSRTSSKRLYGKIFLSIFKYPLIIFLYKRLFSKKYKIYFLTSKNKSDNYLCYLLKKNKISFFRGSLANVRNRYVKFLKNKKQHTIIRLTGDNPFIDRKLIEFALREFFKSKKKYLYIDTSNYHVPYGISLEIFKGEFLIKNNKKINITNAKEHVTSNFNKKVSQILDLSSFIKKYKIKKNIEVSIDYFYQYVNIINSLKKVNNLVHLNWYEICNKIKLNHFKNNKLVSFCSIKHKNLDQKKILEIVKLKKEFWNYPISSQIKFLNEKYKKNFIHNLLYYDKTLIGYSGIKIEYVKNKKFFLLDGVIIKKKFRGKNFSNILMSCNNNTIISHKANGILVCEKKLINFYKKYYWIVQKNKNFLKETIKTNDKILMLFKFF